MQLRKESRGDATQVSPRLSLLPLSSFLEFFWLCRAPLVVSLKAIFFVNNDNNIKKAKETPSVWVSPLLLLCGYSAGACRRTRGTLDNARTQVALLRGPRSMVVFPTASVSSCVRQRSRCLRPAGTLTSRSPVQYYNRQRSTHGCRSMSVESPDQTPGAAVAPVTWSRNRMNSE